MKAQLFSEKEMQEMRKESARDLKRGYESFRARMIATMDAEVKEACALLNRAYPYPMESTKRDIVEYLHRHGVTP